METFKKGKPITLEQNMAKAFEHNWESINTLFLAIPKSAEHKEQLTKALNLISEAQGIIRELRQFDVGGLGYNSNTNKEKDKK